jgi:hypothetical protein
MGDSEETHVTGAIEHSCELRRGIADFGRVEPDGRDPLKIRRGCVEDREGVRFTEVAKKAEYEREVSRNLLSYSTNAE